jgi:signal transduction histidine kinase
MGLRIQGDGMKTTIKSKIIRTNILIVLIALLLFTMIMNFSVKRLLENEIAKDFAGDRKQLVSIVLNNIDNLKSLDRMETKSIINSKSIANRTPIDSSFEIYVKSNGDSIVSLGSNDFSGSNADEDIIAKIKEESYNTLFTSTANERTYYFTISPLGQNLRKKVGSSTWIVQYLPATTVTNATRIIRRVSALLLFILTIITALLGYFRGKSIADPINIIKSRAEEIAKRNYLNRISINTGDEIEELANSMEEMAEQLDSYDKSQKHFIQNITHELKTPLTSIQGYAEGIKDGVFENESDSLDIIIDESKRLKNLVNQIIYLSKLESFNDFYEYSWESMETLVNTTVNKVQGYAVKNDININVDIKDDIDIKCDRDKVMQAFLNILSNSLKFAKSNVFIEGQKVEDSYIIKIYDDGKGFSDKDLLNAFDRFYKGDKGDTGLGLTITKTIINKTGGTLSIRNREGYGGEYTIKF